MTGTLDIAIPLPGGSLVEIASGAERDGFILTVSVPRDCLLDLAERLRKAADEAQDWMRDIERRARTPEL